MIFNIRKSCLIYLILLILTVIVATLLFYINKFDVILYDPTLAPENWCDDQPCVQIELFSMVFILVQPSSTLFVYLLASISIIIGIYLLNSFRNSQIIIGWSIALILWGLGALFAGTSYQAFSYEIKCAGRSFCIWTSWWEIVYLILSVGSVTTMMLAESYLTDNNMSQKILQKYAVINFLLYLLLVVIGSIVAIQFLISFELLVIFLVPCILIFIQFNYKRWKKLKIPFDLHLLYVWVFLIIIMVAYFLYLILGITELLWYQGIWFSENDVLHIALIIWMSYIGYILNKFGKNIFNEMTR